MLTLRVRDIENPFASQIEQFFHDKFPVNRQDATATLEALTNLLIGTNQVRYGPKPGPESLVAIRDTLRKTIARNYPVSLLVPWGSKKPDNTTGPDVAEISAIKQMACFVDRVREIYAPGAVMHIRLEDLGGYYLWNAHPGDVVYEASRRYVATMLDLLEALDRKDASGAGMFAPFLESDRASMEDYRRESDVFFEPLLEYLSTRFLFSGRAGYSPDNYLLDKLHQLGWKGDFPDEQLAFYAKQYERYYPELPGSERLAMLARYFAQAAGRIKVRAATPDLPDFPEQMIWFSFPQPAPGIPAGLKERRVYWRTVPLSQAKTHMPPWRGRGYLKISEGAVTPKITSWHDPVAAQLINEDVVIRDDATKKEVVVHAPYLLGE